MAVVLALLVIGATLPRNQPLPEPARTATIEVK